MHSCSVLATMGWATGATWSHRQDAGLGGYVRKRASATDWPLSNCVPRMILTQMENSQTKHVWRITDSKRFYVKKETMTWEHFLQSCFVPGNHKMVNLQLFLRLWYFTWNQLFIATCLHVPPVCSWKQSDHFVIFLFSLF